MFHRGKDEMELVEIFPATTTIGLIQLLGNKDPDTADQFGIFLSNGTRLENDMKLTSVIKGGVRKVSRNYSTRKIIFLFTILGNRYFGVQTQQYAGRCS